jgi:hypothetical protein
MKYLSETTEPIYSSLNNYDDLGSEKKMKRYSKEKYVFISFWHSNCWSNGLQKIGEFTRILHMGNGKDESVCKLFSGINYILITYWTTCNTYQNSDNVRSVMGKIIPWPGLIYTAFPQFKYKSHRLGGNTIMRFIFNLIKYNLVWLCSNMTTMNETKSHAFENSLVL